MWHVEGSGAMSRFEVTRAARWTVMMMLALGLMTTAHAEEWGLVKGAETLREFMSGLKAERKLPG